jgi:hypothetical protein
LLVHKLVTVLPTSKDVRCFLPHDSALRFRL